MGPPHNFKKKGNSILVTLILMTNKVKPCKETRVSKFLYFSYFPLLQYVKIICIIILNKLSMRNMFGLNFK